MKFLKHLRYTNLTQNHIEMKKNRRINQIFTLSALMVLMVLTSSCVDEYEDANPPRLLDAPAVNSLSISNRAVTEGQRLTLSVNVTDAPAGVDSVGTSARDASNNERGSFTVDTPINRQTSGEIMLTFTAQENFGGLATLSVAVFDRQQDENGDLFRKNSVPRTVEVYIACRQLDWRYRVTGEFLVDDFDTKDVTNTEVVAVVDCNNDTYEVLDITGGLYTTTYAEEYEVEPAAAVLNWDPDTNEITWSDVPDQREDSDGSIIQDPAQPMSNYDPDTNTITIYWTTTRFGERGITTYTRI